MLQSIVARQALSVTPEGRRPPTYTADEFPFGMYQDYIPNPDVTLARIMPQLKLPDDERAYRRMRDSEEAVSTGTQQRKSVITGEGSEIVVGKSRSPKARELHEFMILAAKRIESFPGLLDKILDAVYYGWTPFAIDAWDSLQFQGRARIVPLHISERYPERYRFRAADRSDEEKRQLQDLGILHQDTEHDLVHLPYYRGADAVFETPAEKMQWLIARGDGLHNPYGNGLYSRIGVLWFTAQKMSEIAARGASRSIGLMRIKETSISDASKSATDRMESIRKQVANILDFLHNHNVLLQLAGWEVDLMTELAFSESIVKMAEFWDAKIRRSILLQNLTTNVDEKGSRAAAETHERIMRRSARADLAVVKNVVNDQLIRRVIFFNFGPQDVDDLPAWRSWAEDDWTLEDVAAVHSLLPNAVDLEAVARRRGIPLIPEDEREKVPPPALPAFPPGPQAPQDPVREKNLPLTSAAPPRKPEER